MWRLPDAVVRTGFYAGFLLRGSARRERVARQSVLFAPLDEQNTSAIYRAARAAIPIDNTGGFAGSGVFIAQERHHLALVKVRNPVAGEIGEVAVSVESVDGIDVARFAILGWVRRSFRSYAEIERIQSEWVAGMMQWDPVGAVARRDNRTLQAIGDHTAGETGSPVGVASLPAREPASESATLRRRNADTVRRVRRTECNACGSALPLGVSFCPHCGQDLNMTPPRQP